MKDIGRRKTELAGGGAAAEDSVLDVAQRVSICLQAETVRAVLRRIPETSCSGPELQHMADVGEEEGFWELVPWQ